MCISRSISGRCSELERSFAGGTTSPRFQTAAGDKTSASTVRTISELKVARRPGPAWLCTSACQNQIMTVDVVGDGFLRHMVRAIVGTLVEVGAGRLEVADVAAVLSTGRRERAGPTAPPHGLFLVRVDY